jgi:hypothetical protein
MRWRPLRNRRRHKTQMKVNTAEPVNPTGPVGQRDQVEYEVEVERERRLQARAGKNVDRFVGLPEGQARVLANELDLAIRFFRRGESLTEDYCAGRVSAQVQDGAVIAARAIG